jgi:ribosomal protein S27AE
MEKNRPHTPADPRPGKKPAFIASRCPRCGQELVLADRTDNPEVSDDQVWHDEWVCPACRDRIYLDVPGGDG